MTAFTSTHFGAKRDLDLFVRLVFHRAPRLDIADEYRTARRLCFRLDTLSLATVH